MRRVNFDEVDPTDSLEYFVDGVPFTGEVVEYAPGGELVELITIVDGIPHGQSLSWYRNGQLRMEQSVVRSRPAGRSRSWHPNGQLADEMTFDDTGMLISKTTLNERGEQTERVVEETSAQGDEPGSGIGR